MRSFRPFSFSRLTTLCCAQLLGLALLAPPPSFAAGQPVPISAFFGRSAISHAELSPDGRRLAMLVNGGSGYDRLGVVDLADNTIKVVAEFSNADVGHFQWVNKDRLLYNSAEHNTALDKRLFWPGLFAVNADGSDYRQLAEVSGGTMIAEPTLGRKKLPYNTFMLDDFGAQDSDSTYVTMNEYDNDRYIREAKLFRLDTKTGRAEGVPGPGKANRWWLDAHGKPALAAVTEGNVRVLHYLDPATQRWRKLATNTIYPRDKEAIEPLGFAPNGTLYVVYSGQRDKRALFAYDLAAGKVAAQPLVELEDYDFQGEIEADAMRLLGVHYASDAYNTTWFDAGMKATQEAVDKLLPGRINYLSVSRHAATPFVLVSSLSDHVPVDLLLYNRATGALVKARDGITIPTWLTVPNDSKGKKLPMVVLVHGGPFERGNQWMWSAPTQFLASRGYAVLQPEFRGSTGFGDAHFRAGWKQLGLGMQDDIADATRWAIAQGIADPHRICIAGADYGGYAALMGLVRDGDLYQCGIDWLGYTDLELLLKGDWLGDSILRDTYKRYGAPALVGDPVADAARFAAASPLKQAARITRPVLMAYGGADDYVPMRHARALHEAVSQTNKQVEWVEYPEEGHGWKLIETRLDFWGRVEKFLDRHIGKAAQP
jgi:dipeptidyl aminopeptidase/acylaminoacyl peptidase